MEKRRRGEGEKEMEKRRVKRRGERDESGGWERSMRRRVRERMVRRNRERGGKWVLSTLSKTLKSICFRLQGRGRGAVGRESLKVLPPSCECVSLGKD